jgi:hypothetical protein
VTCLCIKTLGKYNHLCLIGDVTDNLYREDVSLPPNVRIRSRVVGSLLYGDVSESAYALSHRIDQCRKSSERRQDLEHWLFAKNIDQSISTTISDKFTQQTQNCQSLWCLRCRRAASDVYRRTLNTRLSEKHTLGSYENSDLKHITGVVGVCSLSADEVQKLIDADTVRWRRIRYRLQSDIPISRSPFIEAVYEFELVDWGSLNASAEDESIFKKKQISQLRSYFKTTSDKLVFVHFHAVSNLSSAEIASVFSREYYLGGKAGERLTKTNADTGLFVQNFHQYQTLEYNLKKVSSYPFKSATRYKHSFVGSDYANGEYIHPSDLSKLVQLYQKIQKRNWRGLFRSVTNPISVDIAKYRKLYPSDHAIWRHWSAIVEPVWLVDKTGVVYVEGWNPNLILDDIKTSYEFKLVGQKVVGQEFFQLPGYEHITAYKNVWGPLEAGTSSNPLQSPRINNSMNFDQYYRYSKKQRFQSHKSNSHRSGYRYLLIEYRPVTTPFGTGTAPSAKLRGPERYQSRLFKPVSLIRSDNTLVGTVSNYSSVSKERKFVEDALSFLKGIDDKKRAERISARLGLVDRLNTVLSVRMALDFDGLTAALETDENDEQWITEWEEGLENFTEDDLTDNPDNSGENCDVWEEGMDFLSDEDLE